MTNEKPTNQPPQEAVPPAPVNIDAALVELKAAVASLAEIKEGQTTAASKKFKKELNFRINKAINLFHYVTIYGTKEQRNEYATLVKPFIYTPKEETMLSVQQAEEVSSKPASPEYKEEEYDELLAEHFKRHPDQLAKPKDLKDLGPEVERLLEMMDAFEAKHPMDELYAITDLSDDLYLLFANARDLADPARIEAVIQLYQSQNPAYVEIYKARIERLRNLVLPPEEKRKYDIRIAALADEGPIVDLVKKVGHLLSPEERERLMKRRNRITNAVGYVNSLNGKKVEHDR